MSELLYLPGIEVPQQKSKRGRIIAEKTIIAKQPTKDTMHKTIAAMILESKTSFRLELGLRQMLHTKEPITPHLKKGGLA